MAGWIAGPIAERCPNATRCVDPFHVVKLATDALDLVRREVWNEARRAGQPQLARDLKGARENPPTAKPSSQTSNRPTAALPRLPLEGTAPPDLPAPCHSRDRASRRLDQMGPAMPAETVHQARPHDHRATRRDPRRDRTRPLQRPRRSDQHPDPADHPPRVRLPHPRSPDRPREAHPRRPLPTTTAAETTHGNVRRLKKTVADP